MASPTSAALSLRDAIGRGMRTNLGLLHRGNASDAAGGDRIRFLSALLPQATGTISESAEQINLRTRGIGFYAGGFSSPATIGPFAYTDVRVYPSFSVFDYSPRIHSVTRSDVSKGVLLQRAGL